jgi:hypothetical protein
MTVKPHGCGGCDSRWSGSLTAHCAACHRSFGGVGPFDAHRVNGECLTDKQLRRRGFALVREGVLGLPAGDFAPPTPAKRGTKGQFRRAEP